MTAKQATQVRKLNMLHHLGYADIRELHLLSQVGSLLATLLRY
jgi:hypothetical protein